MLLAYVPCKTKEEALKIAEALVKEKLAVCANIIPSSVSVYLWKGKLEKDEEALMFCKLADENEELVEKKIKSMHSYDVPCIAFFEASSVNKEYLEWMDSL